MDSTGFTERQAQRNKKLLEEILEQIKSLKTQVSEIRSEIAKLRSIDDKIKRGETHVKEHNGWFLWGSES